MRRSMAILAMLLLGAELALSGPSVTDGPPVQSVTGTPEAPQPGNSVVSLQATLVAGGLGPLTDVTGFPADDRLLVVEKEGRILVVSRGEVLPEPFLDISDWVESTGNEQGLLSVEFHPRFQENGRVFAFYTDRAGDSQLVEFRVSADDPNKADPGSFEPILEVAQEHQYHQSGSLAFGPKGLLWATIGDGGGIGDPSDNAQDPTTLLGTVIRIDVDTQSPYGIPADNPLARSGEGERGEVWAFGLRNPWRLSIDSATDSVYIPDVGQEGSEEVNVVSIAPGGHNFGWPEVEGTLCYRTEPCHGDGMTMPVFEYLHEGDGCAIVGGEVYRGEDIPELSGHYFYADFCVGWVRSFVYRGGEVGMHRDWTPHLGRLGNVSSFGTDRRGELYVTNLGGEVWKLERSD